MVLFHMGLVMRKPDFAYAKTKEAAQLCSTAQLISSFVLATRIVQLLVCVYPEFEDSSFLLLLYRPDCVGPGWKPGRTV